MVGTVTPPSTRTPTTAPARPRAARARRRTRGRVAVSGSGIGIASASSTAPSISALTSSRSACDVDPERLDPAHLAVDRVLRAPLLDLLLRHVLHVVVCGVAVHAHGDGLDQRRAVARQRPLARLAGGLEHRLGVVAVDRLAGEAVGGGALDGIDGELLVGRRRVRVLVVLEHEDHRQPLDAGPVHGLVEVAARGGAVAEPGHRHALLAAHLEGHRQPGGDEHHVGQHRDHADAARPSGRRSARCPRARR